MKDEKDRRGWGLIGPGRFAREFAAELVGLESVKPVAVASRSRERAESFAREFGFRTAYNDYQALIEDPEVEIVYIALPHVFHREVAERALNAGKAVVCEKPLTPCLAETRKLVRLAREREVFLMEAMKTGFLQAVRRAKSWIEEGRIGEVKLLRADFCFSGSTDPEDRLMNPDLGGGCVLDVGIYPLYLCRFLLGDVTDLQAVGSLADTGVEDSAAIVTRHTGGACASLTASFRSPESMDATIFGTEGRIDIPIFHAARRATLSRLDGRGENFQDGSGAMVTPEIEAAMNALDAGLTECPGHSLDDTLSLAEMLDETLVQIRGS
jgi:predicted dehydrogenase